MNPVPVTLEKVGSSPRVRGTLVNHEARVHQVRFIPACAGNSATRRRCPPPRPVHPRVCGELGAEDAEQPPVARFIPACAGNSTLKRLRRRSAPVHPRVCGELPLGYALAHHCAGSSPRVRGTPRRPNRCNAISTVHPRVCGELSCAGPRHRFIPACAGNSLAPWKEPTAWPVHPRVCGELLDPRSAVDLDAGSSPRVRGTRTELSRCLFPRRFIPACAGNSAAESATPAAPTVHPRVCGELTVSRVRHARVPGSSPRVRGTHYPAHWFLVVSRFIPACAGNSCGREARCSKATVHPRVCGELFSPYTSACHQPGSSPRVRGTPSSRRRRRRRRRFIPACAGNSP